MVGKSLEPFAIGDSHSLKRDHFLGEFNQSHLRTLENRIKHGGLEAGSLSNQKVSFFWVEDYKCSLCGVELPPSFVEERQEHSDYHLAERLQKGESGDDLKSLTIKQRYYVLSSLFKSLHEQNSL